MAAIEGWQYLQAAVLAYVVLVAVSEDQTLNIYSASSSTSPTSMHAATPRSLAPLASRP